MEGTWPPNQILMRFLGLPPRKFVPGRVLLSTGFAQIPFESPDYGSRCDGACRTADSLALIPYKLGVLIRSIGGRFDVQADACVPAPKSLLVGTGLQRLLLERRFVALGDVRDNAF